MLIRLGSILREIAVVHTYYYTDPACPWSWALEPALRKLSHELAGSLSVTYVMCGMAREIRRSGAARERNARGGRSQRDAGRRRGCGSRAPPRSSYPACLAVKAAAEQGDPGPYLRRLREGLMCRRRKLDSHRRADRGGARRARARRRQAPARARLARDPRGVRSRPRPRRPRCRRSITLPGPGGSSCPRSSSVGVRRGRPRRVRLRPTTRRCARRRSPPGRRRAGRRGPADGRARAPAVRLDGDRRDRRGLRPAGPAGAARSYGGWRPSGGSGPTGSGAASCGRRRRGDVWRWDRPRLRPRFESTPRCATSRRAITAASPIR